VNIFVLDKRDFKTKRTIKDKQGQAPWLTPVILATQEAEIRRIMVQSQPWANS
jgi:hypothetical protein